MPTRRIAEEQIIAILREVDRLTAGRSICVLTLVDTFTTECLAIDVDRTLTEVCIVRVLDRLDATSRLPKVIVADNEPELISSARDAWVYSPGLELHHIEPGKPTQNVFHREL